MSYDQFFLHSFKFQKALRQEIPQKELRTVQERKKVLKTNQQILEW